MKNLNLNDEAPQPRADAHDDIGLERKSVEDVTSFPYPSFIRDEEKRLTKDNMLRNMQGKAERGENAPSMPAQDRSCDKHIECWENEGGAAG